jgi:hypothetical protein
VSAFERLAVDRIIARATGLGVAVPPEVARLGSAAFLCGGPHGSPGSRRWAREHPGEEPEICCEGAALEGPAGCACWEPVFVHRQAPAVPPRSVGDLVVRRRRCGDCAYRRDSPERRAEFLADTLDAMPGLGQVFYCHDGIRRPWGWVHPDGRLVDGEPEDYQPLMRAGIPYRADGSPALICAGWAARAAAVT